jgi:predicted ATP-binding protein involved in virulence
MVLDLTRRLAQANPGMTDPAAQAEAIVLIDEIDLHLHPQWQRQIMQNLTTAFPKCQFIATTHSPQVIGEVSHDRIQIISRGQVYSPPQSFGVDSSRVLEEIMEVGPRTEVVQTLLSDISKAVEGKNYGDARKLVAKLIEQVGENDPEVTRTRTLLEFMDNET